MSHDLGIGNGWRPRRGGRLPHHVLCRAGHPGGGPYGQIFSNYVDSIGGELVDYKGTYQRPWLYHCLYAVGCGMSIYGNFFGRALSGASAQLKYEAPMPPTDATVFRDNVCYGGVSAVLILDGFGNVVVTGNVLIAPQLVWRGTPVSNGGGGPGDAEIGVYMLVPEPDITISGNYIEGAGTGVQISDAGGATVRGLAITYNTIAGGYTEANFSGGLPSVMNGNYWAWPRGWPAGTFGAFALPNATYSSDADFKANNTYGFDQQSAGGTASLISESGYDYDAYLGGDDGQLQLSPPAAPLLPDAMTKFLAYAAAQIGGLPPSTYGATLGDVGGDVTDITTLDASGKSPSTSGNPGSPLPCYAGGQLNVDALAGLVQYYSSGALTAALAVGPANGTVTVNPDGSFYISLTPALPRHRTALCTSSVTAAAAP